MRSDEMRRVGRDDEIRKAGVSTEKLTIRSRQRVRHATVHMSAFAVAQPAVSGAARHSQGVEVLHTTGREGRGDRWCGDHHGDGEAVSHRLA